MFILFHFQEFIKNLDILATFSTDPYLITLSLCHLKNFIEAESLIKNVNYHEQLKTLIKNVLKNYDQDNVEDPQFCW